MVTPLLTPPAHLLTLPPPSLSKMARPVTCTGPLSPDIAALMERQQWRLAFSPSSPRLPEGQSDIQHRSGEKGRRSARRRLHDCLGSFRPTDTAPTDHGPGISCRSVGGREKTVHAATGTHPRVLAGGMSGV